LLVGGSRDDGSTALSRPDGTPLHSHFFGQSSFATHALASERALVPIRTSAPLEAVGVLACGIATGAGAVLNALHLQPGAGLVMFGAGAVGLAVIMAARLTPDPRPLRLCSPMIVQLSAVRRGCQSKHTAVASSVSSPSR
jgi:Zn-dependent alcohol dehydrogenase